MIPKVSVIMPIYRVERYLPESLESVCSQTLGEIEIICVDDGSPDGCAKILDRAAAGDNRIRVLHNENHGYGYSINDGFRHAKGKYLAILEPDDVMPARALETLYRLAVQNGADVVKGDYCELRTGPGGERRLTPARLHPDESLYDRVFCAQDEPTALVSQIINCSGIFRRKLIEQYSIRLSETPGASYQDVSLFFPLMLRSRATFYTHQFTYLYRNDNPGASTKDRGKLYLADQEYIRALEYLHDVTNDERLAAALWCARWRGALGTLGRIDMSLSGEFLRYMRLPIETAWKSGLLQREYCSAYQWTMLRHFLRSDKSFLHAFALSDGKTRNLARLWWRLQYDGIPQTLSFLWRKNKMRSKVKEI